MQVTTMSTIPGYDIVEIIGIVEGSTVRAKHLGRDFMAELKNLVGGEIRGYTELLEEARTQALERMRERAEIMGADAVVTVRLTSATVSQRNSEILAYGTAVKLKKNGL